MSSSRGYKKTREEKVAQCLALNPATSATAIAHLLDTDRRLICETAAWIDAHPRREVQPVEVMVEVEAEDDAPLEESNGEVPEGLEYYLPTPGALPCFPVYVEGSQKNDRGVLFQWFHDGKGQKYCYMSFKGGRRFTQGAYYLIEPGPMETKIRKTEDKLPYRQMTKIKPLVQVGETFYDAYYQGGMGSTLVAMYVDRIKHYYATIPDCKPPIARDRAINDVFTYCQNLKEQQEAVQDEQEILIQTLDGLVSFRVDGK